MVVTRLGSAVTCASSKRGRCLKSTTHTGTASVAGARFVLVTVVLSLGRSKYNTIYLDAREREQNEKNGKCV